MSDFSSKQLPSLYRRKEDEYKIWRIGKKCLWIASRVRFAGCARVAGNIRLVCIFKSFSEFDFGFRIDFWMQNRSDSKRVKLNSVSGGRGAGKSLVLN